jgi:RNA polymerase sigma-70 factor (ECF subfamily)
MNVSNPGLTDPEKFQIARHDDRTLGEVRARLVAFAVKLIWNRADAEEIVQETFRVALEKRVAVSDLGSMPWMMRTVANLAMNRRRKLRPEPLGEHVEVAGLDEDRLEKAERLEELRRRIAGLPDQQRLALTLRMLEEREYEEIAGVMEISVAAVRTHVHLARQELRRGLAESES